MTGRACFTTPEQATDRFSRLEMTVVPFDGETAALAGRLRTVTRHRGLSLGDRACLALALRQRAKVVTADRSWAGLGLPIDVELIRS